MSCHTNNALLDLVLQLEPCKVRAVTFDHHAGAMWVQYSHDDAIGQENIHV